MAKKSMNPADAHRKAQRAKELKRNKEDRKKTREVATLKKDTGGLEARIGKLAAIAKPTKADEQELASLRAELEYTSKLKRDYVEKHPEHRKFVYAREVAEEKAKQEREDKGEGPSSGSGGGRGGGGGNGLYDRDGRLRRPERSLYYDPVLNPYGVPPPGMPYRERPPTPEPLPKELQSESESESSSEDDSDDDIVMPAGPPPGASSGSDSDEGESSDSDDSIIFPSGPPPPKAAPLPPLPPGPPPPPGMFGMMPPPPGFNPHVPPPGFYPPQPHMMMNQAMMMPPQPAGFYGRPPPPPPNVHIPYQPGGGQPPFHGGAFPPHPPNHRGARAQNGRRPPGPSAASAVPARPAAPASASAPASISSLPPKPGSSLPANPTAKSAGPRPPPPPPAAVSALDALASSTSAAEPVLRDFKKESAAFVPAAVKRRRKEEAARDAKRVKAAPDVGGDWGAPLEGFDDDPSTATSGGYAPLEGFDDDDSPYAAPTSVAAPATVVPKVIPKATGPISFGSANNPLLGGLASVLGKAGFVPRTAAAAAPKEKKPDRDGYGAFLSGLDGLDK